MEGREEASSGVPDPAVSYGPAAVVTGGGGVYNAVAAAAAARSESPPVVDGGIGGSSGMMSFATSFGKKRGRPRRYDRDEGMALALTPISASSPGPFFQKRSRGRPPGSGNKQRLAALGNTNVKNQWLLPPFFPYFRGVSLENPNFLGSEVASFLFLLRRTLE